MVAITLDHDPRTAPTGDPAPMVAPRRRPDLRLVPPAADVAAPRRPLDRLLAVLAAVVLVGAAGYLLFSPTLAAPGTIPVAEAGYVAEAGDTMWSIAQDLAPAGEASSYVERLVAVNGTSTVVPGQTLQLPRS